MATKQQLESTLIKVHNLIVNSSADSPDIEKYQRQRQVLSAAISSGQYEGYKEEQDLKRYQDQAQKDLAEDTGIMEALAVSFGKGIHDVARVAGVRGPESEIEKVGYQALEEEHPISTMIGKAAGQTAPFAPLGVGAGAIPNVYGKIAGATVLGGLEGGVVSAAEGGNVTTGTGIGAMISGGLATFSPFLGKLARKAFGKITGRAGGELLTPDGLPTPEFQEALDSANVTWESLKQTAQDIVSQQHPRADPEQVARLAGFKEMDSPATRGQITKDFEQQKLEQGLLESATEPAAEPVRQIVKSQSEAFRAYLDDVVDQLGVTQETGSAIKEALTQRKAMLKSEKNRLYSKLAEEAKDGAGIPVFTQDILDAMPDRRVMRDLTGLAEPQMKVLNDVLVEYGINQSPEAVEAAIAKGIDIDPLSLENFESFRIRLNTITNSDPAKAATVGVATGPLKRALDAAVDEAAATIERAGSGNIANTARQARQANIALRTEFDESKITSKLIDSVKRGSTQPKVEASQAYNKIMNAGAPIENLERVMSSLKKSGPNGKKAIQEMQARAVLDLVESAFSAQSRQIGGQRTFGGVPFSKQFEKLEPKLKTLFADDPQAWGKLENAYNRAQDIIPPAGAMPKGSAGYFIDTLNRIGVHSIASKLPFANEIFEVAMRAGEGSASRKIAEKAIMNNPDLKELAKLLDNEYPRIATLLGITGVSQEKEEKRPNHFEVTRGNDQ